MERRRASRKLRLWSAASSIGPEPYTMAITASAALATANDWDARILATDIDSNAVAKGQTGVYPRSEIPDIDGMGDRRTWFEPGSQGSDQVQMSERLRSMIYFRQLNLMEAWPMTGPIDVIFCRNVVIYFSQETQRRLYERFAEILAPDGYVFIGHSESMLHSADLFQLVGRTIYQPTGASG
jgi:chemotaxis protein methyltransferase CheR